MSSKAACVIGWPVEHSRSPLIHGYWIKQHGLDAAYRREAVPPDRFVEFVTRLEEHGYVGANVTVPHKQMALALAKPDARADMVGAANTLWLEDGSLHATNTDVEGFVASLDAAAPKWDRGLQTALVLGAGGAARAIVCGLIGRGVERVQVANRTLAHAVTLQEKFGKPVQAVPWGEIGHLLPEVELLVNTTTLGMAGQPALDCDLRDMIASAVVADIVYAPLETALLKAARARGLRTVDGLGMLLHQAVGGFVRWFGVCPQVTPELRALVEADLARK